MDEHYDIILPILSWAWLALVGVMVWFFKRVSNVQSDITERRGVVNTAVAVLQKSQEDLRKEFDKESKQNNIDHKAIIERIDKHHTTMMSRLDSLLTLAKNGSK